MRLCYVADASSVHTQRWLTFFVKRGHEVHLISSKPADIEGVTLHPLPDLWSPLLSTLWGIKVTRSLVKKISPDVLHAHYVVKYGWLGAYANFHPFVLTAWGSDVLVVLNRSWIYRYLVRRALAKADLVTCDGEHLREPLVKLGLSEEKLRIVYFGVDTKKFSPGPRSEELLRGLGIPDSPIVISLRSLNPIYDVGSLVRSVPLVLKEVPEAKFLIFGKGSEESALRDLAKSLGVERSVRFMGSVANALLPQYLTSANVYVSTSLSDAGLAASTAEAMACALPVIVTDFGDNRKWVVDGENGFVVPLKDPEALAEKILYLLKNKDIRIKFGLKNRKIIETRNDYYEEMEKMENIYKTISNEV